MTVRGERLGRGKWLGMYKTEITRITAYPQLYVREPNGRQTARHRRPFAVHTRVADEMVAAIATSASS
jgi:hypothetical protein